MDYLMPSWRKSLGRSATRDKGILFVARESEEDMMLRYQHLARVALFLLPVIVGTLPASAKDPNAPPPPDPLRWLMTAEEMRNAGLALRIISRENIGDFGADISSYPNKCYFTPDYELAV